MQIRDAYWTPQINMLKIVCDCGATFDVRSDRWKVVCPSCHKADHLAALRNEYIERNQQELEDRR